MKAKLLLFFILNINLLAIGQSTVLLKVIDSKSGEPIIGANVFAAKDSTYLGYTNANGEILLKVSHFPYKIFISYLGYQKKTLILQSSKTVTAFLERKDINISPIVVSTDSKNDFLRNYEIGRININTSLLEAKASFLGEDDPFKFLQIYSGVNFTTELSSNYTVYGSLPSENLILLDDIPVFNINHLGGFVSILPGNTVKNITFYKSFIPARYSGRTASVLNATLKDGNINTTKLNSHISTLAVGATIDGPIKKNKLTYLISFRRTYPDLFLNMFFDKKTKQYINFYDIIGKITWRLSKNLRLQLISYNGQDNFRINTQRTDSINDTIKGDKGSINTAARLGLSWQNNVVGLRLSSRINSNLLSNIFVYYSHYSFDYISDYRESKNYINSEGSEIDTNILQTSFGNFITEKAIKWTNILTIKQNLLLNFGIKLGLINLTPDKFYLKGYLSQITH